MRMVTALSSFYAITTVTGIYVCGYTGMPAYTGIQVYRYTGLCRYIGYTDIQVNGYTGHG